VERVFPVRSTSSVIPIEAVAFGDMQVLAAGERTGSGTPVIDLDVLADFPTVESVVVSTQIRASREIPNIRELLFCSGTSYPDATTLRHLTGLEALYSTFGSNVRLDLDAIPAGQMRKLAINRWLTKSLAPLERMTNLEKLKADLFRDPLEPVAGMKGLKYLSIIGPAKGWAKLRDCTLLEEAHFIDVQIANLRRWNTWNRLRSLTLSGRGVKSLSGLENVQSLETLTLLNTATNDLKPLRELGQLASLTLRMPAAGLDLESVAQIPMLRSLTIDDSSNTDADVFHIPTLTPIEKASALSDISLRCAIDDGQLTPLARLPRLRKVKLASYIGADVETLRVARPDVEVDYTAPDAKWAKLKEIVGRVTIRQPGEGMKVWSIFESLAELLNVSTNYAAERLIIGEVKRRRPDLARRLHWDTEGGAVGISADAEADIRSVAEIINQIVKSRSQS